MRTANTPLLVSIRKAKNPSFMARWKLVSSSLEPFRDLITLTFHGMQEELVWQGAQRFRAMLTAQLHSEHYMAEEVQILGPAPAQIARINYHYRCRLTLSCRNSRSLRQLLAHLMRLFLKDKQNKHVGLYTDVNSNE